jgi:hypothetical protein
VRQGVASVLRWSLHMKRTYSVYVVRADGREIAVRKRGTHAADALERAVRDYPSCRTAWVYLSDAAKAVHIGRGGVAAYRDGGLP